MSGGKKLVGPWRRIHGAVWLIGLAILFWKGWWWPGILVMIAVSAILEAVIQLAVPQAVAPALESEGEAAVPPAPPSAAAAQELQHRAELLPSKCPGCGAPVRGDEVRWTGPQSADCQYCGTNLPMHQK